MASYDYGYMQTPVAQEKSSGVGIIILIVVVLLIVAAVAAYFYFYYTPSTNTTVPSSWKIINSTESSFTFDANQNNALLIPKAIQTGYTVTLNPPASAEGQMFLVVNYSASIITMKISGTNNTVAINGFGNMFYLWVDQTNIRPLRQT